MFRSAIVVELIVMTILATNRTLILSTVVMSRIKLTFLSFHIHSSPMHSYYHTTNENFCSVKSMK